MSSILDLLNSMLSDYQNKEEDNKSEDNKSDKTMDSKKSLLDYLDDYVNAYYQEIQKYIDKTDNGEEENQEESKKEVDKTTRIGFLDSIYEVPENIKNNVTNYAVEYFDKIIYPVYDYDEKERKDIIETLADFACWIYKNK